MTEASRPEFSSGKYANPTWWGTWTKNVSLREFLKFRRTRVDESNVPDQKELDETLPIRTPDFSNEKSKLKATWLGHATVVAQIGTVNVIMDPIFSERCSPVQFVGPRRYRRPACTISELPPLDAVVISHSHYDHLDHGSVTEIKRVHGDSVQFFVPMGLKAWFHSCGIDNVQEKTWWEESVITGRSGEQTKIVCVPAQHWSRRTAFDGFKTLWCGWVLEGAGKRFYFSGDTGYCPAFAEIGAKFGPIDISAIPIGCYEPRWFMQPQHINPEEAVKIHVDVQSRHSFPIHWGTFHMGSTEFYLEPRDKLIAAVQDAVLPRETFEPLELGQSCEAS